jgi:hypothetical protein
MAEPRTAGSGGTSPAQEGSIQIRDKAQAVSVHVSETARQVGETALSILRAGTRAD